jgi:hypothetical protein
MSVGANIRRIRLEKGLTQAELADRLSVSQSMLCQIERETKNPSLQVCRAVAEVLDCKIETLLADPQEQSA